MHCTFRHAGLIKYLYNQFIWKSVNWRRENSQNTNNNNNIWEVYIKEACTQVGKDKALLHHTAKMS